ncbi:hypothetical protein [Elstera litoralis]
MLRARDDEIDNHRRPPGSARRGAAEEIFRRHRAHERQFHMGMRIDPAGHHILPASVDNLCPCRSLQVRPDGDNLIALAQNIGPSAGVGGHDRPAANE